MAAYKAKSRNDLMKSITQFSNQSLCIVLPVGEFPNDLLAPLINWMQTKIKNKCHHKPMTLSRTNSMLPITAKTNSIESFVVGEQPDQEYNEKKKKPDPFKRTGCLFGSLIKETRHRYSEYLSDLKDGLNLQCLIAAVFTFTICFAPALTFGGILGLNMNINFDLNCSN